MLTRIISLTLMLVLVSTSLGGSKIDMRVGDSRIITLSDITRISVADPQIADVINLSEREVFVLAKNIGSTELYIWSRGKRRDYVLNVSNFSVSDTIRKAIGKNIDVLVAKDMIILKGIVMSEDEKNNAEEIAKAYAEKVTNLLRIAPAQNKVVKKGFMNLEEEIEQLIGLPGVRVKVRDKKIILDGYVTNQNEVDRAKKVASVYTDASTNVIDLLEVRSPYQVMIEAMIIDIQENTTESLGIDWGSNIYEQPLSSGIGKGTFPLTEMGDENVTSDDNFKIGSIIRPYNLLAVLKALIEQGKAKLISSPTMLTMSGRQASLNVGGQVPVRNVTIQDQIVTEDFEYREHGLSVVVTPEVEINGDISMDLSFDISDVYYGQTQDQNNNPVPGFLNRSAQSLVTCPDGETIAISGLMREKTDSSVDTTPFLSKIPGLGKFFKNKSEKTDKSELLILLTPHLIKTGDRIIETAEKPVTVRQKVITRKTEKPAVKVKKVEACADNRVSKKVTECQELVKDASTNLRFRTSEERKEAIRRAFSNL